MKNKCKCGNLKCSISKQCQECYISNLKGEKHNCYIDGRTLKKYYCKDCKKEISYQSGYYGKGKCASCAQKKIDGKCSKKYFCKCGKEISYQSYKDGLGRCNSCAKTGKNNPSFQEGNSRFPYSLKFNDKLKEFICARDNYTCQGENCSMTQEEHLIIYDESLQIHHIDYDKMNYKEQDLITLCLRCNVRANFNRNYWFAYFTYLIENK